MADWYTIITTGAAVAGIAYGMIKNTKAQAVIKSAQSFAVQAATYIRIKEDGTYTIEEKQEMGEAAITFFEDVEKLTGEMVINAPQVPWLKAAKGEVKA